MIVTLFAVCNSCFLFARKEQNQFSIETKSIVFALDENILSNISIDTLSSTFIIYKANNVISSDFLT